MLSPEGKIGLALTTGVMVYGIYQVQMPSATDVRLVEPSDADVESAERAASWMAGATVAGVALVSKSPEVFVIGGIITVALAWTYRHADQVSPLTKKASGYLTAATAAAAQMPTDDQPAADVRPVFSAVI